jgi:hypothetical protein
VNLVFINAGAAGTIDEDVLRGILALSPIVSFRIHVTPGGVPPSWLSFLNGTEILSLSRHIVIPYSLVIIVPRMEVPGMTDDASTPESNEARKVRKARDANLTKLFHQEFMPRIPTENSSAVYGQPDANRSPATYRASNRDIAKVIVRRAHRGLLSQSDLLNVFTTMARLVQDMGEHVNPDIVWEKVHLIFSTIAEKRLSEILSSLVLTYAKVAQALLLHGTRAFEVKAQLKKIEKQAINEFYHELDALPPHLQALVTVEIIDRGIHQFHQGLLTALQDFLENRQEDLRTNFSMACASAVKIVLGETKTIANLWKAFMGADLVSPAKTHFTDIVQFDELPPDMQDEVEVIHNRYLQRIQNEVTGYVTTHKNKFYFLPLIIFPLFGFYQICKRVLEILEVSNALKNYYNNTIGPAIEGTIIASVFDVLGCACSLVPHVVCHVVWSGIRNRGDRHPYAFDASACWWCTPALPAPLFQQPPLQPHSDSSDEGHHDLPRERDLLIFENP